MTPLAIGKKFDAFNEIRSGSATYEIDGDGVLTTFAPGVQRSYARIRIQASPGMKVKVSAWVKRVDGHGGGIFIDFPEIAEVSAKAEPTSDEWEFCSAEAVASTFSDPQNDYFQIAIGVPTAGEGTYKFCYPSVEIQGGGTGFAMARFSGLISLDTADQTASLNENFFQNGIESIEWDDENTELIVNTDFSGFNQVRMAPIIYAQFTLNQGLDFFVRAGSFDRSTGTFALHFFDSSDPGAGQVKLPDDTGSYFIWVIGFGIG